MPYASYLYPMAHPLKKTEWIVIAVTWAAIQMVFLFIMGINDGEEARKYISAAQRILDGTMNFSLHNIWYSGYIALHILVALMGLPVEGMYVVQLVLSFVSLVHFVKLLSMWVNERWTLIISALLYATCFIIQQWVAHLYTDTVFYMLLVIATYYLVTAQNSLANKTICCIFILLLPFFRPVGLLFVLLACIHWLTESPRKNRWLIFSSLAYFSLLLYLALSSLDPTNGYYYPLHNAEANIICGYESGLLRYQTSPYEQDKSILHYFINNPGLTLRLFTARLIKVFDLTRPFFSTIHNVSIAISSVVYYCLALVGITSILKRKQCNRFVLMWGTVLFAAPSVMFCVEWHGRMSLPVICYVLVLAGIGVDEIASNVRRRMGAVKGEK